MTESGRVVRAATAGVERALHTLRQQINKEADHTAASTTPPRTSTIVEPPSPTPPAPEAPSSSTTAPCQARPRRHPRERVTALAADPPDHLRTRLGPFPANEAGRPVWCH